MTSTTVAVITLISVIMGGSGIAAIAQLVKARTELRQIKQSGKRLPAEVDSIWLVSAEKAVSILQVALDRTEAQVANMTTNIEYQLQVSREKDARIRQLEKDVESQNIQIATLQRKCDTLAQQLEEIRSNEES